MRYIDGVQTLMNFTYSRIAYVCLMVDTVTHIYAMN